MQVSLVSVGMLLMGVEYAAESGIWAWSCGQEVWARRLVVHVHLMEQQSHNSLTIPSSSMLQSVTLRF